MPVQDACQGWRGECKVSSSHEKIIRARRSSGRESATPVCLFWGARFSKNSGREMLNAAPLPLSDGSETFAPLLSRPLRIEV